jgi:hypothetical protein
MTGRPPYSPTEATRKQVDAMAGYGVPELAISRVLGIGVKTLRKYYQQELDTAHIRANTAVAQFLFKKATSDGPQAITAAIFWLKCRAGWKDTATPEWGKKEQMEIAARAASTDPEWGADLQDELVH